MNAIIVKALELIAHSRIGEDFFTHIQGAVERWNEKTDADLEAFRLLPTDSAGDLKRRGALAELPLIARDFSAHAARLGIELAVDILRLKETV